jgi:hypothetical protein
MTFYQSKIESKSSEPTLPKLVLNGIYIPKHHGDFEMKLISINPIRIECVKTDEGKGFKIGEKIKFTDEKIFHLIWVKK